MTDILIPIATTWRTLLDDEQIALDLLYDTALCQLAALSWHDKMDRQEKEPAKEPAKPRATAEHENEQEHENEHEYKAVADTDLISPDISDPQETVQNVIDQKKPLWWPEKLDRLEISIKYQRTGAPPDKLGPMPHDPNVGGLGRKAFRAGIEALIGQAGAQFEGILEFRLTRKTDHRPLAGWRGEVYVGDSLPKKKRKIGDKGDGREEALFEYAIEEGRRKDELIQRMFANASNVIQSSASALSAMRGVNVGPPWMKGEENQGQPVWLSLAQSAMEIALGKALGSEKPNSEIARDAFGRIMNHPVKKSPGALESYGGQRQLPGPVTGESRPTDDLGYDQYMEEDSEFSSYRVTDDDLLDDGFIDEVEQERPAERQRRDGRSNEREREREGGNEDEYEHEHENEHENENEQDESRSPEDMSPAELAKFLDRYIEKNAHRKDELKTLGLGLAKKLL